MHGMPTDYVTLHMWGLQRVGAGVGEGGMAGGALTCELDAEHDHAGHPEEEDVMPSLQESPRVELGKVGGLVGPPHGREGPQATAEPGVQHIVILHRCMKDHTAVH